MRYIILSLLFVFQPASGSLIGPDDIIPGIVEPEYEPTPEERAEFLRRYEQLMDDVHCVEPEEDQLHEVPNLINIPEKVRM